MSLVVEPEDGETVLFGLAVSEMQDDIVIDDSSIMGTLKHVTGYTGFDYRPEMQEGNYLALKVSAPAGSTTTVEVVGGYSGPIELDSDMNIVLRIESNTEQSVRVTSTSNGVTFTKNYDLTGLELLNE